MILYIDETENADYFIVAGLLVDSPQRVQDAYKRFKKGIKGIRIPAKYKSRVYTEFKATLLDKDYPRIKLRMLKEISELEDAAIVACHIKKNTKLNQVLKESIYITLLSSILGALSEGTYVIFDRFGKPDFEGNIIRSAQENPFVLEITPKDSQTEPGLQFIDNICSVIRAHKSGDASKLEYYEMIRHLINEV